MIARWLLWGFVSTLVMTTLLFTAQGIGLTRMNVPYLLGTMFTPRRDRAKAAGFVVHLANGWAFALIYMAILHGLRSVHAWTGALVGAAHAIALLAVGMPLLPTVHPRMASEQEGPTAARQLEPPGFFALHYGVATPVSIVVAHVVYGALVGALCP